MAKTKKLKTKFKYIKFVQHTYKDFYTINGWDCFNNRRKKLGLIEYYPDWDQHVMSFLPGCVFNYDCLLDIARFIFELNNSEALQIGRNQLAAQLGKIANAVKEGDSEKAQ